MDELSWTLLMTDKKSQEICGDIISKVKKENEYAGKKVSKY